MDITEYQLDAMRTKAPYRNPKEQLINAALGIAGEGGEFCDHVKKFLAHGHELDKTKVMKELGDILWYVAEACDAINCTMSLVARMNIEKLRARYPEGFDTNRSINKDETKE